MKYKIVPEEIVKNMIEFLDEIQFEAAKSNDPEDIHRINFCNWIISELMYSTEGVEIKDEDPKDKDKGKNKTIIDDIVEDLSEEEFAKLKDQFDRFITGWNKEYKKSKYKKSETKKKSDLKNFSLELKMDEDLTPQEKFELYYDEYKKYKVDKGPSLNKILKDLGIKRFDDKN